MTESVFAPAYRATSIGVLMSVTIIAFQGLGVGTVMPAVARDLGGLEHYGWAFSAFFLASVIGSVAAGQDADRHGPLRAYEWSIGLFIAGSVLAAVAWSWGALMGGRVLEGMGSGALGVVTYASASRVYPPAMYGRMLALMSSAWVLPSLVGPAAAGLIAEHATWRLVFVVLLPFLPVAVVLTRRGLRGLAPPTGGSTPSRLRRALLLAVGLGVLLAGLELRSPFGVVVIGGSGLVLALPALRGLLPPGTLRVARGLPSGIIVRGLLAVAFLGCDAFMPLALTELRGFTVAQAGLVISAASVSWSLGSFGQAAFDRRDGGAGRRGRALVGLAILLGGVAIAAVGLLDDTLPVAVPIVGWVIAGAGIGIGYASVGALVLAQAPSGEEGGVAAALQLIETISIAAFTGAGGALIALGLHQGWDAVAAIAVIFGAGALAAFSGLLVGRRAAPV